jgi:hypothetical protein
MTAPPLPFNICGLWEQASMAAIGHIRQRHNLAHLLLGEKICQYFDRHACGVGRFAEDAVLPAFAW